jgi:L-threonylcarbamoyladenylate synthase
VSSPFIFRDAARCIRAGGIIAYPTESVYGLGCHPLHKAAVYRLLELKQRQADRGLILIAHDFTQLTPFLAPIDKPLLQNIMQQWPGPHTWLLPVQPWVPYWIRGRHETLAVRVTAHPLAAALTRSCGTPLVSTSANISHRTPAKSPLRVRQIFGEQIDLILSGPLGGLHRPTPIRDARSGTLLRA